eukprot:TRINITY_DN18542_c0_g1_i1.p1 TRINITY_DN18542_c0_g1~~TRINITY_DN18542_c0_g1_i1.p1  ORF type:complete len:607 (+),score=140.94 TRINITY_DN18542_c0_g1_i1:47-1822(+)
MNLSDAEVKRISDGCLADADFMKSFKDAVGDMDIPDPQKDPTAHMEFLKKVQETLTENAMRKKEGEIFEDQEGKWTYTMPEPAFCIKTTSSGNKKVFINICKSKAIAEPMPMTSEEVEASGMANEDLQYRVPISIGPARIEKDKAGVPSLVYDIAVNPTTLEKCNADNEFKRLVCAMCTYGLKQKHEPDLDADQYKQPNLRCKGVPVIQRVRISRETNSFGNEINIPDATKPGKSTGNQNPELDQAPKAKIEVISETRVENGNETQQQSQPKPSFYEATKFDDTQQEEKEEDQNKRTVTIEPEGDYDWSAHKYPAQNSYWQERQQVPATLKVSIHIPEIKTSISECDIQIEGNQISLSSISDDDTVAEPFDIISVKFPVLPDPLKARFVKKKKILSLTLSVQLPDELEQKNERVKQSMAEKQKEEHQETAKKLEQDEAHKEHMKRVERQKKEDQEQQDFNKNLVETAKSIQAGALPPELEEMVTSLSDEETKSLLARLTSGKMIGDSVDQLLEKLPATAINSLINVIRDKLGLAPTPTPPTDTPKPSEAKPEPATKPDEDDDSDHHYGFDKMSEKMFGIKLRNRYVFALDL